jgi:molecular chaperone DnaJ
MKLIPITLLSELYYHFPKIFKVIHCLLSFELYISSAVSFAKAALGGKIRIKTIDGDVEYEIKAGTETDTRIRLRGKGVPAVNNPKRRGDHYVTLVVQVPKKMNRAQKEALKKYAEAMGETL